MPNDITEKDYLHHTTRQLQRLARELQEALSDTGLTISEISRQTRLNWDTVYKALNRRPVRFDSAERLRYFCQRLKEQKGGKRSARRRDSHGHFLKSDKPEKK